MTTTQEQSTVQEITAWRGVAIDEDAERTAAEGGSAVRLREDSRALLASLVRPHWRAIVVMIALLLLQNAAAMAGPYLVKIGIDRGIPHCSPILGTAP